jgi:hypothetical protein
MNMGKRCTAVFFLLMTFGVTRSSFAQGNLLANPSFETPENTSGGFPTTTGDWNGNYSEIVTAQNGITPVDGTRMLHFLGTAQSSAGGSSAGCTVVQLYAGPEIVPGATLTASALFNRISNVNPSIDTQFNILIRAHTGSTSSYDLNGQIAESEATIFSDNDPATWESASTTLTLPAGTTYVAVLLDATENVFNDQDFPEFYGHYADSATLTVPEPSSLAIVGICGVPLLRRRTRARRLASK